MKELLFDLEKPEFSYMIGFMQADGYLNSASRGRGQMRIELGEIDTHILEDFQRIISVKSTILTRTRDTNFKKNATSVTLAVYNKKFRETIQYYGVPSGKKSNIIEPPKQKYSQFDYWRGIIDADGSLGITSQNMPFISLVTASDNLANAFMNFIFEHTGFKPEVKKNKRDEVFNIMLTNEKCQTIVKLLYYEKCLCLKRKYNSTLNVLNWIRPVDKPIREHSDWTKEEKELLLKNSAKVSVEILKNRKKSSVISMRNSLMSKNKKAK